MYRLLISVLPIALAGCAATPGQPDVDYAHGAKHGWISELYSSATPRTSLPACLATFTPAQLDQQHFARISYRHVRHMLTEVGQLPDNVEVNIDDRVEIFPADCDKGRLSRISRLMPKNQ